MLLILLPMLKAKNVLKIVGAFVILIGGISIYFLFDNLRYQKELNKMAMTGVLESKIETTVEHKVLKREGYSIHYYTSGDKDREAVILLHPAFADHRCFNKQLDDLSKEFHVISLDMLGHGQSKVEKAKDKIDASVDHLNEILVREGHAKVHLVGVSMGTLIAQQFALLYPEKVYSLTIISGYNIHKEDKEVKRAQSFEMLKWVFKALFSMDNFRKYVATVSVKDPGEQAHIFEMAKSFTRESFSVMSGLNKIIQVRETQERNYPLLLISGAHDIELSKRLMRKWHEDEPESFFYSFENAGHCVNMEEGPKFNELVLRFFRGELGKKQQKVWQVN